MHNTTIVIDIDESEFGNAKAIRSLINDGYYVSEDDLYDMNRFVDDLFELILSKIHKVKTEL